MKTTIKAVFIISVFSFLLTVSWWLIKTPLTKVSNITSEKPDAVNHPLSDNLNEKHLLFSGCHWDKQGSVTKPNHILVLNKAKSFQEALAQVADENKDVILSIVDYGLREFALNLYISSIVRFNFKNHLFVCTDRKTVGYLSRCSIPCFLFHSPYVLQSANQTNLDGSTDFGSYNYITKTNMKTRIVLDALIYGFNVLICDLDIVILKDPFPYFNCEKCDLHITKDRQNFNSGFLYAKSTILSIKLYQLAWDLYMKYHKSHDQSYINMAIRVMQLNNDTKQRLSIEELSSVHFPCGYYYFRSDFRMFNNTPQCENCVIVHNNYIGSSAAKVYRFKENLLWYVDSSLDEENTNYYSNSKLKFISYKNPSDFGHYTYVMETQAVKNAMILGTVLNRTVILPTFRCCNCKHEKCDHPKHKCSLLSIIKLNTFDKEYSGKYREHVFLWNNMVPNSIKRSPRVKMHLNITDGNYNVTFDYDTQILNIQNKSDVGNLRLNVLKWLRQYQESTLIEFEALYGDFSFLLSPIEKFYFNQHELTSFQCSDYDQWEENDIFADVKSTALQAQPNLISDNGKGNFKISKQNMHQKPGLSKRTINIGELLVQKGKA